MNIVKKVYNRVFIEALSGMASGLFATLIIGTIIQQIGTLIGGSVGDTIYSLGKIASMLTGAGIGVGVACRFEQGPLVTVSSATAGMVGAFASSIMSGTFMADGTMMLSGPGEPLGAFLAAYIGMEIGGLVAGKTRVDILVTPLVVIGVGSAVGLFAGPYVSDMMTALGNLINWGVEQHKFTMGIVVSVLMGMILTLPISSAALGIILNLSGLAAGAATVGCCANMVGFAVASFRENGIGGLLAQGIGTSMLQVPNIMKKPIIWLPAIITSAILGPISTIVLGMTNNATGSGMGSAGFVGQIMCYQTMITDHSPLATLSMIIVMHFIAPALLSFGISEFMRKHKFINYGDMELDV